MFVILHNKRQKQIQITHKNLVLQKERVNTKKIIYNARKGMSYKNKHIRICKIGAKMD